MYLQLGEICCVLIIGIDFVIAMGYGFVELQWVGVCGIVIGTVLYVQMGRGLCNWYEFVCTNGRGLWNCNWHEFVCTNGRDLWNFCI